jgi:hypothetical protein
MDQNSVLTERALAISVQSPADAAKKLNGVGKIKRVIPKLTIHASPQSFRNPT